MTGLLPNPATRSRPMMKSKSSIRIISNTFQGQDLNWRALLIHSALTLLEKNVMDIGSSTGGFTDCALKHGADRVVAIDVGTDLMASSLRDDERVELHEQMNFKDALSQLFEGIDIIESDVSFISLKHIIDRISLEDEDFELVFLIKPQFECGKEIAHKFKGVIDDRSVHEDVIWDIRDYFTTKRYHMIDLDVSKMPGKSGNIEICKSL